MEAYLDDQAIAHFMSIAGMRAQEPDAPIRPTCAEFFNAITDEIVSNRTNYDEIPVSTCLRIAYAIDEDFRYEPEGQFTFRLTFTDKSYVTLED